MNTRTKKFLLKEYIKEEKKKVEQILEDSKVEKFIRYSLQGGSTSCN